MLIYFIQNIHWNGISAIILIQHKCNYVEYIAELLFKNTEALLGLEAISTLPRKRFNCFIDLLIDLFLKDLGRVDLELLLNFLFEFSDLFMQP